VGVGVGGCVRERERERGASVLLVAHPNYSSTVMQANKLCLGVNKRKGRSYAGLPGGIFANQKKKHFGNFWMALELKHLYFCDLLVVIYIFGDKVYFKAIWLKNRG
jgi:hypothetical protein